jgi:hypothetical protein
MFIRSCLVIILALSLSGCWEPYKKSDEEARKPLRNAATDTTFLAFIGRLRIAVHRKDAAMISSLMAPDFGYTWEEGAQPGAHIFEYWEQNGLWPVLADLLNEKFEPQELFLVSPPALKDPNYNGPRCGMRQVGGSWRFAYFLPSGQP